jgi:hypothetical protein
MMGTSPPSPEGDEQEENRAIAPKANTDVFIIRMR